MVCRVCTDEDHVACDSGGPNGFGIFEEFDLVDSTAVRVWYDDRLVLCKVGGRVGPPLFIRGNMG